MDSEKWRTIKRILDEAAACPASEKQAWLEREYGEDPTLVSEVESFLAFDEEVEDFIEHPLWSIRTKSAPAPEPKARKADSGRRIGAYRLLRPLARGGMGVVFLAAREDDYEQRVAFKLVSWGMDSEEVLRRFYTERQILANLQHPGISRLLDGGTTEDGTPYFVMEYVDGEPIDQYCDKRQLPVRRRLELFRNVCAIVHYAHQNLVVHRDLKPGNILITDGGEPKLLDFGIAKLLQPHRLAEAVATVPGRGPMTPDYASPEQIKNLPITTACDVYALGVLLYRLLSGQAPYQLKGKSYDEMVDLVCHSEPRRPSTAPTPPATRPGRLGGEPAPGTARAPETGRRQLAGDLDAIVMKAMRKEPLHRYASALELAGDLQRHLSGLPVEARQGTWTYAAGKFLRRHKLGLAVVLLVFGLTILTIATTVLWRQALQERAQADRERTRTEFVSNLFIDVINSADPDLSKGEEVSVREILARARTTIAEGEVESEIKAELLGVLGTVLDRVGWYDEGLKAREEVLRIRRELYASDHPHLATALNNLAASHHSLQDYARAEEFFRLTLEMRQRLHREGSETALAMFNLASMLAQQDELVEADELHRKALAIYKRILGPDHQYVARSLYGLAVVELRRGEAEKAESLLRQAHEIFSREYGSEHTEVANVLASLGKALQAQGDLEEAKVFFEQALDIRLERLGSGHAKVATTRRNLERVLLTLDEAEN